MGENTVQQAAAYSSLKSGNASHGSLDSDFNVAISMVINARGRACLIHDGEFEATPVWIKYLVSQRKIQFIYDNGTSRIIDYVMDDKKHKLLLNINKLFLIRTDNGKPIEAFDTNLIKE